MKKLPIFVVALVSALCLSSCEKNDLSTSKEPIKTSYWKATLSNGYLFYVGIDELTEEDKNNTPFEVNEKCTNKFMVDILNPDDYLPEAQLIGMAYQEKNQIKVQSIFSIDGENLPITYEYDGKNMSCTYEGETVQFAEITKEQYDADTDF